MRRSPAVVDRKAIAEHAWADETDPLGSNAIDVQMSRLRAKLPTPASGSSPSAAPATGWRRHDRRRAPATSSATNVRASSIRVALAATARRRGRLPRGLDRRRVLVTRSLTDQIDQRITASFVRLPHDGRRRRPAARTIRRRPTGSAARRSSCGRSMPDGSVRTSDTNPALPGRARVRRGPGDRDGRGRRPAARRPAGRRRLGHRRAVARAGLRHPVDGHPRASC